MCQEKLVQYKMTTHAFSNYTEGGVVFAETVNFAESVCRSSSK